MMTKSFYFDIFRCEFFIWIFSPMHFSFVWPCPFCTIETLIQMTWHILILDIGSRMFDCAPSYIPGPSYVFLIVPLLFIS
jgi:hypothetical protein